MSPWGEGGRWQSRPKKPPPSTGIKMKRTGATWWGRRWIDALEAMSAGYASRLSRGRTYARAGRTHDLQVKPGQVTARVTGSGPRPYRVTLSLALLDDRVWSRAIEAMASQAVFAAELLSGQMPEHIDEAFQAAGASLFPTDARDLQTDCSCPDWANPCKHVAATHYVLGEALDKDPFLLFELRGRTRDQVLDALRRARAGAAVASAAEETGPPSLVIEDMDAATAAYDTWHAGVLRLPLDVRPPAAPAALLRQLGKPASWSLPAPPEELLGALLHAASARALAIAQGEHVAEPDERSSSPPSPGR